MIIKISDSNISVFFLDCFRFQVCGNEYNVLLNKRDIDLYHYEIWKKDGDNLVFVDDVFLFRWINLGNIILRMKDQQILK